MKSYFSFFNLKLPMFMQQHMIAINLGTVDLSVGQQSMNISRAYKNTGFHSQIKELISITFQRHSCHQLLAVTSDV